MKSALTWFEIFVADLDRATRFYEGMLDAKLRREEAGGLPMAIFPHDREAPGGALVRDPKREPGGNGAMVYLDVNGQLDACVARAAKSGGEVMLKKTSIGDPGFIALVRDTEGNLVGLHSVKA